ncbi:MAG: hypothetical protein V4717_15340 [Bacteroidota bacterium]
MKRISLLLVAATMISAITFVGCQKEVASTSAKKTNAGPLAAMTYPASCSAVCIEHGSGDYYTKTGSFTGAIGSNSKAIAYTVYNTETDFVVVLNYTRTPAASGSGSTVKVTVNGNDQTKVLTNSVNQTYTFPLASGWKACDVTTWSLTEVPLFDGALPITGGDTYGLIGVCNPCVNALTADYGCDGSVTFTFTATEAGPIVIQGGLTDDAIISTASSNVLTRNLTHPAVINSSSSVTRWEGTVEACQVVTVTITFEGGNGIGAWSAKRNDVVLGSTEAVACQ